MKVMSKVLIWVAFLLIVGIMLLGLIKAIIADSELKYDKAVIYLPDLERVSGDVEDYQFNSDGSIEVVIDGVKYCTCVDNVVLYSE